MFNTIITALTALIFLAGGWFGGQQVTESPTLAGFSDPFLSIQLATDPDNGECLTTDGTDNTWSSCASGSGGGANPFESNTSWGATAQSTSTPVILAFPEMLNASGTIGRLTVGTITATSSTPSTFVNASTTNLSITELFSQTGGRVISLNAQRTLFDENNVSAIDFNNRELRDSAGQTTFVWEGRELADAGSFPALTFSDATALILNGYSTNGILRTSNDDGTLIVDTNTYLTGNQTLTLSGAVSGSGATAITTSFGSNTTFPNSIFAHSATSSLSSFASSTIGRLTVGSLVATSSLTFGGITGTAWTDFCESITGSADLCDGSDATGAGGGAFAWTPDYDVESDFNRNATSTPLGIFSDNAALTISNSSRTSTSTYSLSGIISDEGIEISSNNDYAVLYSGVNRYGFIAGGVGAGLSSNLLALYNGDSGFHAYLDHTALSAEQTFTFPDWTGIFAVATSTLQVSSITSTSTATSTFVGGLNVAGTSGLTVLQNGKVGIDKINPVEKFDINGGLQVTGSLATNKASAGGIDFNAGITRLFSWGADATTKGEFEFRIVNSSGSQTTTAIDVSNTGLVTMINASTTQLTATTLYAPLPTTALLSATSTLGTGTTTLKFSGLPQASSITEWGCIGTGTGTFRAWFGDGTSSSTLVQSATGNTTTFTTISSNNTFTRGEAFYIAFGSVSGAVAQPSCSYTRVTQ